MGELYTIAYITLDIWYSISEHINLVLVFIPAYILFEMPLTLLTISGIVNYYRKRYLIAPQPQVHFQPKVSCIITCYAEAEAVMSTITSFIEQTYQGDIEIIAVVDGAVQNKATYHYAKLAATQNCPANRKVIVLPKWQRGGRVSTLNAGLHIASGEIVINADADTSFDNDMVSQIIPYFLDPNVPAVGGALRVRNIKQSILTKMQSLEYIMSMQGAKTGLAQWNLLNNISGAFGAFRRKILIQIGGWDTHTAEDLDLTIRLKQYFKRNPNWHIPFATLAIGHTDAPASLYDLVWQRLRWDGDLLFLYLRKHWPAFSPKLLGLSSYLFTLLYGYIQNVLLPAIIVIYTLIIVIFYPWQFVFAIFINIYLFYLFFLIFFYLIVLTAISERVKQDLSLIIYLPIYPFYSYLMRLVCLFALFNEMVRRSHEESSMAPWWVLKRGRRF